MSMEGDPTLGGKIAKTVQAAAVVVDAIRCAQVALDADWLAAWKGTRGIYMKSPPRQMEDQHAARAPSRILADEMTRSDRGRPSRRECGGWLRTSAVLLGGDHDGAVVNWRETDGSLGNAGLSEIGATIYVLWLIAFDPEFARARRTSNVVAGRALQRATTG